MLYQTYLLETTRVTHHQADESNFHVFYQILTGASKEERAAWGLFSQDRAAYAYIRDDLHLRPHADAAAFLATKAAMVNVGLCSTLQCGIFGVVAAILHLGNIGHQDCSMPLSPNDHPFALKMVAQLLHVPVAELADRLLHRTLNIGPEVIRKPMQDAEFASFRDSLAKSLYSGFVHSVN